MKQWYTTPERSGYTYHLFNQGNNGENIFKEERNYVFFLKKLEKEILPIMQLFAFVLMPNHFHLMGKSGLIPAYIRLFQVVLRLLFPG